MLFLGGLECVESGNEINKKLTCKTWIVPRSAIRRSNIQNLIFGGI